MQLRELESALRAHPGVCQAAVISWQAPEGEKWLVGYVVPNDAYLESVFGGGEEERKRVQKWRKTFDLTQFAKEAQSAELGFNIAGWNSSYTRQPIPGEEMREWVEFTVKDILSLQPKQVLEVGCGTGLLLLRIAHQCARYVGTDFAPAVLGKLKKQMEQMEGPWNAVSLLERPADNFEGFEENSFDTAVMNSVTQHFPSVPYLTKVVEGLVRAVQPGGKIFIGDVRSLPILEAYAVSVELFQATAEMSLAELFQKAARRVKRQEQLVISPAFFLALAKRSSKIARADIHPKRGRFGNEMTRFRFDAILHLDSKGESSFSPDWQDWDPHRFTLPAIRALLQECKPESFAIKNVRNARIEREIRALAELSTAEPTGTVGAFRKALENTKSEGIHPEDARSLGEELGYQADLSWANSRPDGSYDLLFRRLGSNRRPIRKGVSWPQPANLRDDLARYANTPGKAILHEKLLGELREHCAQRWPQNAMPVSFVLLGSLPMTPGGQVNSQVLPPPDAV